MLSVKKLRKRPRQFVRFTGLSVEQFDQLLFELEPVYRQRQTQRLNRAGRRRELGAGHPFRLPLADRLLATLLYLRLYVSGALLGYLFNLDESSLSRERNLRMLPALLEVLPVPMQDHLLSAVEQPDEKQPDEKQPSQGRKKRGKRIGTLKELLQAYPEFEELWLDGTEQEVPKPQDKQQRKQRFSGKHKCHTLKTQVVTARTSHTSHTSQTSEGATGRNVIVHTFGGLPGSLHDHVLLRASGVVAQVPKERIVRLDRGYEGVEKEYPDARLVKAKRARRNHPLNLLERYHNRALNKLRMPVEHSLGQLKKFAVLSGIYRGPVKQYEGIFDCVAGLHNFRSLGRLSWDA